MNYPARMNRARPVSTREPRHGWCLPELSDRLSQALAGPLPKIAGHVRMAPRPRTGWKPDVLPKDCRSAAALLLLYPKDSEPHILLTLRTQQLPTHQGQVSLPGGGVHSEETLVEAALREAREEVGIDSEGIRILGLLSPLHIPVSGFILYPVVAVSTERPAIHPHEGEVERVLETPLSTLTDTRCIHVETWSQEGLAYRIPYFLVEDTKVWGATAMVLSEFLCLIGSPPSPRFDP